MNSAIGVVYNPRAGGARRDPKGALRLARQLGDRGVLAEPRSLDELHRAAESFRAQGVSVVGVVGGDGTSNRAVTACRLVYGDAAIPTLAMLRGGTMNTVANACGVPRGRPEGLLRKLMAHDAAAGIIERNTLSIGDRVGFLFGTGVVVGFLRAYYAAGEPSPVVAARVLARAIGSTLVGGPFARAMTAPVDVRVSVDGVAWPSTRYLTVAAGTVEEIGLGFRPFYRASEAHGRLHLLGVYASPARFASELPRIHRALPMRDGAAHEALVDSATLTFDDGVARYMFDGDLVDAPGPLTLRAGPRVRIATLRAAQ